LEKEKNEKSPPLKENFGDEFCRIMQPMDERMLMQSLGKSYGSVWEILSVEKIFL
jgi:hypothetical protein